MEQRKPKLIDHIKIYKGGGIRVKIKHDAFRRIAEYVRLNPPAAVDCPQIGECTRSRGVRPLAGFGAAPQGLALPPENAPVRR